MVAQYPDNDQVWIGQLELPSFIKDDDRIYKLAKRESIRMIAKGNGWSLQETREREMIFIALFAGPCQQIVWKEGE